MKPFGLIGGTSWHSTLEYYQNLNGSINRFYGNNTNPTLHIISMDQHTIHHLQSEGNWNTIADIIKKHALELQNAGVKGIALCANTPHKVLPMVQDAVQVPFVHIADAVGDDIKKHGWSKVALLGTIFTMQEDFIKGKLLRDYQIECIVPCIEDQTWMQEAIIEEMSVGVFTEETKARCLQMIDSFSDQGAEAVILGCTEIPLLLRNTNPSIPTIDSLTCHCEKIVSFILEDELSGPSKDFTSSIL
jgi:aspartate racemase